MSKKEIIIIKKPWGHEEIWAHTTKYLGKYLFIKAGHRLSRQYHRTKEETITVLYGTLCVEIGEESDLITFNLSPGECYHVKPGVVHRFCALPEESVKLVEVSTPELQDVVRLDDDYQRDDE